MKMEANFIRRRKFPKIFTIKYRMFESQLIHLFSENPTFGLNDNARLVNRREKVNITCAY